MKKETEDRLLWALDSLDAATNRLQRHCPKCGGNLHRKFSLLDKIGLYIAFPHTIYAMHKCDDCHARFRSYLSLTDLFLEAAWVSALLLLGEYKWIAIACPITWLGVAYLMKNSRDSSHDTVTAGAMTGALWMLALVFGNPTFRHFFMNHSIAVMPVLLCMLLAPVFVVLVLDRYTNFRLREY